MTQCFKICMCICLHSWHHHKIYHGWSCPLKHREKLNSYLKNLFLIEIFLPSYKCFDIRLENIYKAKKKINPFILPKWKSEQKKLRLSNCSSFPFILVLLQTRNKYIRCRNYCRTDKRHWRTHGIDKPCLDQRWQMSLSNLNKLRFTKDKNAFYQPYELSTLYAAYFITHLVLPSHPPKSCFYAL